MSTHKIIITEGDRRRLTHLLTSDFTAAIQSKSYLTDLRTELQRAEIVDAADVPDDVITMNSTVNWTAHLWLAAKGSGVFFGQAASHNQSGLAEKDSRPRKVRCPTNIFK